VVRVLLHGVGWMQKVSVIEMLGEVAHHLVDEWRDPRLLLMDRCTEDCCSSSRDEDHHCGNDARRERLEGPEPLSAEHGLKHQFQHALSVGEMQTDGDSRNLQDTTLEMGSLGLANLGGALQRRGAAGTFVMLGLPA
jgi:hypothetical protein